MILQTSAGTPQPQSYYTEVLGADDGADDDTNNDIGDCLDDGTDNDKDDDEPAAKFILHHLKKSVKIFLSQKTSVAVSIRPQSSKSSGSASDSISGNKGRKDVLPWY